MKTSIIFGNCEWTSNGEFKNGGTTTAGFPVPKLTTSISKNRTASQQYLGSKQTIELDGIIFGSGAHDLLSKAYALKNSLIVPDPQMFKFNIADTSAISVISGTGYITDLQFDTNKNHAMSIVEYKVSIEFDVTTTGSLINNTNSVYHVSDVNDNISISTSADTYMNGLTIYPLYDITRTISAKGSRYYASSGAIIEALRWINDRRTYFPFTGIIPTGKFPLFNHSRSLDINELDGSINIVDKFVSKPLYPEEPWLNKYSITAQTREDMTEEISIKGNIIGLSPVTGVGLSLLDEPFSYTIHKSGIKLISPTGLPNVSSASGTKFNSAISGFRNITGTIYSIASGHYNINSSVNDNYTFPFPSWNRPLLNPTPTNYTETFNPYRGEITYSCVFDNRPKTYISGAISEILNVSDTNPAQRILSIPVLGRRLGPVVYFYSASSGLGNRSVSYEGVFVTPTGFNNLKIDMQILNAIDDLVDSFAPSAPYTGYVVADNQKINIGENRISRGKTWSYTKP